MFYRVEFNVSRLWSAMFRPNLCSWLRFNLINPSYEHEEDRGKSHVHPRKIQGVVVVVFIFCFFRKKSTFSDFPQIPLVGQWVQDTPRSALYCVLSHSKAEIWGFVSNKSPDHHITINIPLLYCYYTITIYNHYIPSLYHHYTLAILLLFHLYTVTILSRYHYYHYYTHITITLL